MSTDKEITAARKRYREAVHDWFQSTDPEEREQFAEEEGRAALEERRKIARDVEQTRKARSEQLAASDWNDLTTEEKLERVRSNGPPNPEEVAGS